MIRQRMIGRKRLRHPFQTFSLDRQTDGEFRGLDAAGVENAFGAMQGNVGIQLLFMGIVVVLGMLICSRGLKFSFQ